MENIEKKLELLNEQRKKLMELDSFDEIKLLWNDLNKNYNECKQSLEKISQNIASIEHKNENSSNIDIKNIPAENTKSFKELFNEMQIMFDSIADSPIEECLEKMQQMNIIYQTCLQMLEKENVKITQIDLNKDEKENKQ